MSDSQCKLIKLLFIEMISDLFWIQMLAGDALMSLLKSLELEIIYIENATNYLIFV